MVVINGVKYACERCIRGHRVTSCTHTDQPLTMIKPKGRPATQCAHCREQRKMKNLHSNCTCGNKKKHAALCGCHKTSHCTCKLKQKAKLHDKHKQLLLALLLLQMLLPPPVLTPGQISAYAEQNLVATSQPPLTLPPPALLASATALDNGTTHSATNGSAANPAAASVLRRSGMPMAGPGEAASNYVIEDVVMPFEMYGMFDLFSRDSTPNRTPSNPQDTSEFGYTLALLTTATQADLQPLSTPQPSTKPTVHGVGIALGGIPDGELYLPQSDLEMVDRMFPLFPLVGLALLENEDTLFIDKEQTQRQALSLLTNPFLANLNQRNPHISQLETLLVSAPMQGINRPELVLLDLLFDVPLLLLAYPPLADGHTLVPKLLSQLLLDFFNPGPVLSELDQGLFDYDERDFGSGSRYRTATPLVPEDLPLPSSGLPHAMLTLNPALDLQPPFQQVPFLPLASFQ